MLMTVIETPVYLRYADAVWREDEREAFVDFIAANPEAGDVIPQFAPLRKVRWSKRGTGKRGGVRVIYFVRLESGTVSLLMVYPKSTTDNLSHKFLKELRKLLE
ncbi:MAG: type II toxin-antitoxin system RelE/ParE family toxin [Azonexus sp.]|jgi:mRNA-degrading endonuclease RelE of RelBE toxin-antitoxin system|nr:type II toxin-antitoxin system RelE/ParE family toxin [Azonexus sp.]